MEDKKTPKIDESEGDSHHHDHTAEAESSCSHLSDQDI